MNIKPLLIAFGLLSISIVGSQAEDNGYLLIDDFTQESSKLGTSWEGFTDQVMGGVSEMSVTRIPTAERSYIRMSGEVSLERNGGFIQLRLKLAEGKPFNGSSYSGVRLTVRGKGSSYYLFLRTAANILPWKFYKAKIPVSPEWQTIDIPWENFKGGDYGRIVKLNLKALKSIALTAYGEAFNAEIEMSEIGFY